MRLLLIGYMYLFIHRPFEIWPVLGDVRVELLYSLFIGFIWLFFSDKQWPANSLHLGFSLFVAVLIISWLLSPWTGEGVFQLYKYLQLVFFYLLYISTIRDEASLKQFLNAFLIIMSFYMLHSLWEFRNGRHVHRMGIDRLIGVDNTLGDPNALAANILLALALLPASWVGSQSKSWKVFLLLYSMISVACVGLTGSRGGLVVLIFLAVIMILRSNKRWLFAGLAVTLAPILWMALPPSLQNRFETIIHPEVGPMNAQVSAVGRLEGFRLGAELWNQFPLTGCGPGAWKISTGSKLESHNLYGQVIGELGALGAFSLGVIVFLIFWNYWHIRLALRHLISPTPDYLAHLADCLAVATLLLLLNGVFSHNLYRFNWLWFGGFLIVTRYCIAKRAVLVAHNPGRAVLFSR